MAIVCLLQKKQTSVRLATYKTESDGAREIMLSVSQMTEIIICCKNKPEKHYCIPITKCRSHPQVVGGVQIYAQLCSECELHG